MNLDQQKLENLLYTDKRFNGLFDYFSLQERARFLDILSAGLNAVESAQGFQTGFLTVKGSNKQKILEEIQQAKSYFAPQSLLDGFDADYLIQQIANSAAGTGTTRVLDDSKINPYINLGENKELDLFDLANFESIKAKAYNFIDSLDCDSAIKLVSRLEQQLYGMETKDQRESYILNILKFWVLRLKVFAFRRLKQGEKLRLIKESLVDILSYGFDLKNQISSYTSIYQSVKVIDGAKRDFLSILTDCQNSLGSNKDLNSQRNFKPTVEDWIKEYQAVLKPAGGMKLEPGTFHIVKFLDTNQYAKMLSDKEKEVLRGLLDLYNWLLSPTVLAEEPIEAAEAENPYVKKEKFVMPPFAKASKGLRPEEMVQKAPPKVPPAVPQGSSSQAASKGVVQPSEKRKPARDIEEQPLRSTEEMMAELGLSMKPTNIQDILSQKQTTQEHVGLKIGSEDKRNAQQASAPAGAGQSVASMQPKDKLAADTALAKALSSNKAPQSKTEDVQKASSDLKLLKQDVEKQANIEKKLEELRKKVTK